MATDPSGHFLDPVTISLIVAAAEGAAIGAAANAATAAVMGGDVGQAAINGAIGGAIGAVNPIGASGSILNKATSAALAATVTGGDPAMAAATAGVTAGIGAENPFTAAGVGAVVGGAAAEAKGGEFGEGAANGAVGSAFGSISSEIIGPMFSQQQAEQSSDPQVGGTNLLEHKKPSAITDAKKPRDKSSEPKNVSTTPGLKKSIVIDSVGFYDGSHIPSVDYAASAKTLQKAAETHPFAIDMSDIDAVIAKLSSWKKANVQVMEIYLEDHSAYFWGLDDLGLFQQFGDQYLVPNVLHSKIDSKFNWLFDRSNEILGSLGDVLHPEGTLFLGGCELGCSPRNVTLVANQINRRVVAYAGDIFVNKNTGKSTPMGTMVVGVPAGWQGSYWNGSPALR